MRETSFLVPLKRVIFAAYERYRERSGPSGRVRIPHITEEERDELAGLLGEPVRCRVGQDLLLPLTNLDDVLRKYGWEGIAPTALAMGASPGPTRQQIRETVRERRQGFTDWMQCRRDESGGTAAGWLDNLLAGRGASAVLIRRELGAIVKTEADDRPVRAAVDLVARALEDLPARDLYLPVFAQRVAGDPHALDEGASLAGRLFARALDDLYGDGQASETTTARNLLWRKVGILADGISSSVACFGLRQASCVGHPDAQVAAAHSDRAVLVAPLRQVQRWIAAVAAERTVYVVENPAVFEVLVDRATDEGRDVPLVCSSGFPSAAVLHVLDLLVANGHALAYGGDFDPTGLQIAQSIKERYGAACSFWGMSLDDYLRAARHPAAPDLSETDIERLRQFEGEIAALAVVMCQRRKRAFQEAVLPALTWERGYTQKTASQQSQNCSCRPDDIGQPLAHG